MKSDYVSSPTDSQKAMWNRLKNLKVIADRDDDDCLTARVMKSMNTFMLILLMILLQYQRFLLLTYGNILNR